MDYLKEYLEAWSSRVKSPVVGSIILSYVIFNWKAFYYLLFAETSAAVRIRFFDLNTRGWDSFIFPVVIGVVLAVGLPWINLLGSLLALKPMQRSRDLQINESIRVKAQRLSAEADLSEQQSRRERAKIEQERNLQIAESVGGESLRNEITASRNEIQREMVSIDPAVESAVASLDDFSRQLVIILGDADLGLNRTQIEESEAIIGAMRREAPEYSPTRFRMKLDEALGNLSNHSLVVGGNPWWLSAIGYRVYDQVRKDLPR